MRTCQLSNLFNGPNVHYDAVANENNQIQSFPRRFLDPRRPKQNPTTQELEEWLIQYDPVIPDDPKRVLSHNYQERSPR